MKKDKMDMKLVFAAGIAALMILLGGCSRRQVNIEDRNFVLCLGLDLDDDQLVASMGFPDLEALTGEGNSLHYPAASITGEDLADIISRYGTQGDKRLDFGQLQVIVFGRELLKNTEKMEQILAEIADNQEFMWTIMVCMADNTAKDIVDLDESINGSIGIYLRQMFENNQTDNPAARLTIGDLIIGRSLPDENSEIACLEADPSLKIPYYIKNQTIKGYVLAGD